ncbi:MAG: CapA family protein [Patescibacteria group bacterium]
MPKKSKNRPSRSEAKQLLRPKGATSLKVKKAATKKARAIKKTVKVAKAVPQKKPQVTQPHSSQAQSQKLSATQWRWRGKRESGSAGSNDAERKKQFAVPLTWHHSLARFRSLIVWSFMLVAVFAVLSIVSGGSVDSKKSPIQQKLAQVSTLTLDNENADATASSADAEDNGPVVLIATGDVMLARYTEQRMRDLGDYTFPFQKVAEFLNSADITMGNLESPFFPGRTVPKDSMVFRADLDASKGLVFGGFDVVSLANNHTMGYQVPGLTSTIQELKKANILYAGAGKNLDFAHTPAIIEVNGKKIAFYAYNDQNIPPKRHGEATATMPGIAKMDIESVKNDVKNALTLADAVIVSMHSGHEYNPEPTAFQKEFAHAAIDAGATAVIGTHPHIVEPVEFYKDGVIFYSLGNFVSDQFFSEDVQTGLAVKIMIDPEKPVQVEFFPVKIDKTQPRLLEGEERENALEKMGLK